MCATSLRDLGEFSLIDRIVARLGAAAARDIIVPPGDDAAVWRVPSGAAAVGTIDALTEGNHWRRDTMSMADAGWRAVAANVSDLAAMGAEPAYLLVALNLAPDMTVEDIDDLTQGLMEACLAHHVRIAGGDIVAGAATTISVAAYGHLLPRAPGSDGAGPNIEGGFAVMRRDAARPGDAVAISGAVGASAAGLALIERGANAEVDRAAEPLLRAHRRPRARTALGSAAARAGVRCGMDISDGVVQDLGHIARASRAGIEVDAAAVPLHPAAVDLLGRERALNLALGGGEDYELILCGPAGLLQSLGRPDVPVTVVGRVVAEHPGAVVVRDDRGSPYEPPSRGWDQADHLDDPHLGPAAPSVSGAPRPQ